MGIRKVIKMSIINFDKINHVLYQNKLMASFKGKYPTSSD